MEEVKRAKERAESYLYKTIEQKWDSKVENDKYKLTKNYYEQIDWPLRFEAYSYLGNRYKNKNKSFANELRKLWNEWIGLSEEGLLGDEKVFWPTQFVFAGDKKSDKNERVLKAYGIETYISMLRAKEILVIDRFDAYFNEPKKMIKDRLFSEPHIALNLYNTGIIWQIVRSPFLKSELSDHLKVIAQELMERESSKSFHLNRVNKEQCLFFLCFGNFDIEIVDFAKKAASEWINRQEKDGPFLKNLLTTCLFGSSIHFLKLDTSNSVCNNAIEYILEEQNKEGYWQFLWRDEIWPDYHPAWSVLSTVVVLETLDYITNDEPLPVWVTRKKIVSHQEDKKQQFFTPRPFPAPEGTSWKDVHLIFKSDTVLRAIVNKLIDERYLVEWGLKDRRDGKPNVLCYYLQNFKDKIDGKCFKGKNLTNKQQDKLKKNISRLRELLKWIFKIYKDPFPCKNSCYEPQLKIKIEGKPVETKFDFYSKGSIQDEEIKKVYTEDIQKKTDERKKKIEYARKEEIEGKIKEG